MWRKALFFGAIFSVIFVFPLAMQAAVSTSVDLYGGYLEDVVIGPDGYGYSAFMAPNGLYVSSDLSTWDALDPSYDLGECTSLGVDNTYVYAICGIELYRSSDGSTWDQMALMNVNQYMYADDNRVVVVMRNTGAAGYMTLAISEDQGTTWTEDVEVIGVGNFLGMSFAGDTGYALASVSDTYWLYKTVDGGYNWSSTGYSFGFSNSSSVAVKESNSNHVALQLGDSAYISTDGGVNFTDLGLVAGGEVQYVGDTLYSGLQYTTDYSNWTDLNSESLNVSSNDVAISGDTILGKTSLGVAVSLDAGTTWTESLEGINGLQVDGIAQKTGDKDKVILAIYGGVARTENYTDSTPIWTFNTDHGDSTAVFFGSSLALMAAGENIYYSTDDAETWTLGGPAGAAVTSFLVNGGVYYASTTDGVIYSTDGTAWTDFGLDGLAVNALDKTGIGNMYAAVGGEGDADSADSGIYKYSGGSWTQVASGTAYSDVIVATNDKGSNVVYATVAYGESGSVVMSTDYGTTWSDLTANGLGDNGWYKQIITQDSDDNVLYASTGRPSGSGEIYKSLDAGDNWSLFYTGLRDETFNSMLFDDLMVGSNAGLQSINSQAKIKITRNKNKVKKGNKVKLTVTLTDKDTGDVLVNKPIKLYRRDNKDSGTWKLLKTKKTGPKGKVSFNRKVNKKTYWKVVWKPNKAAVQRVYGSGNNIARTNSKLK